MGGEAYPARTDLALHGFILDELKAPWALFRPVGGLVSWVVVVIQLKLT